ncbi:hypothetical protein [Streptomyces marianii]|uniref:Uncharacterized protein n=1 Tax=Streptomyces marianii TaxID=1817406 RepID=A0A5R9DT86_9ACTN|nr:hypothetical protein [Streptomyces marianii]TLQ38852.1 hypothetical protein FEF34_40280 [Streptomyces marianii]
MKITAAQTKTRREEFATARLSLLAEASTSTQYRAAGIEENVETTLADYGIEVTAAAKWGNIRHHIADYAACTADQDDAETLTALYEAVAALDEAELDAYRSGERDALPAEITARVRHDLGPCGEVLLPLPARFRKAYETELADVHHEADSALYRQVCHHVTSGRTTAPRWLLGPLADVAALLADLDEEESDLPAAIRTARRRSYAELFTLLARHGARPWPRTGHGVRPWGDAPAHCDDCAELVGHRAPGAVVAEAAARDSRPLRTANLTP